MRLCDCGCRSPFSMGPSKSGIHKITVSAGQWMAAFAPEGFFEIWGILPQKISFQQVKASDWRDLARGILNTQRFYRHLCRNGYNLGLLAVEMPSSRLELRIVIIVRSNYAPWIRSDHTGFEVMLGDMTTFSAPEQTAFPSTSRSTSASFSLILKFQSNLKVKSSGPAPPDLGSNLRQPTTKRQSNYRSAVSLKTKNRNIIFRPP